MKQPKFRGYCLETKQWYFGHGWFEADYTEDYLREKGIEQQAILHTEYSPIECELKSMGQHIGIKDKDGREVFEGDICSIEYGEPPVVVRFENSKGRFIFDDIAYETEWKIDDFHLDELRVIGNIYENSYLLEQ